MKNIINTPKLNMEVSTQEAKLVHYIRDLQYGSVKIEVIDGKAKKAFEVTETEKWVRFDLPK